MGSDDLVARLRKAAAYISGEPEWKIRSDCRDAADEIERLNAALASRDKEIERLRKLADDGLDIGASRATLCEDVRRATDYGVETSKLALQYLSRAQAAEALAATATHERDEARAALRRLLEVCPEEHGCFPRNRCSSEHAQSDDDELAAALAAARAALHPEGAKDGQS